MKVVTKMIRLRSRKENDIINVTDHVSDALRECDVKNGVVVVFVAGSTAAVTTIEYEPGLLDDFPKMLSRVAPRDIQYRHDDTWHDGNGHSHVRASLVGPSLSVPFSNGRLVLGKWQQIVMLEMDTSPRERILTLQVLGE